MIDILRQNDCKVFNTTRGFAVTVRKPAWGDYSSIDGTVVVPSPVPTTGTFKNAVATTNHRWCSTRDYTSGTYPQPYWYGMDLAINGLPGAATLYRVYKTYYITFRNQA